MKKILSLTIALSICQMIQAQNPFEEFGYKGKILTATNGKFNEFHDLDSVVQIGSILLDVHKLIIVGDAPSDTVTYMPSPTIISRWLSPDPLSEKFYESSPYNFTLNNPINAIDPDGQEVYFLNGNDAATVLADLNKLFRDKYKLDYDVFKTETRTVKVDKEVTEKAEFDLFNPDTWDGEVTKTVQVDETRSYIQTNNDSDFDWNKNKYTEAVFDVFNTTKQFQGEVKDGNTLTPGFLKSPLSEAKGFSLKDENKFLLSNTLSSSTSGNWSYAGTTLHELANHFHPLGNTEDNTGLQSHFGLPRSRMTHSGNVKTKWSAAELKRLKALRSKSK